MKRRVGTAVAPRDAIVRAPLETGAIVRAPLETGAIVRAPLETGAIVRVALEIGAIVPVAPRETDAIVEPAPQPTAPIGGLAIGMGAMSVSVARRQSTPDRARA